MSGNTCRGCGREFEDEKLAELQNVRKQSTRQKIQVGDKIRFTEKKQGIEEGSIGIVSKIKDDTVEVAFNPQKPFDLVSLKKHDALSISGGPIWNIKIEDLDRTTELVETSIHKYSPNVAGQSPPSVTIYSKVWEFKPEVQE